MVESIRVKTGEFLTVFVKLGFMQLGRISNNEGGMEITKGVGQGRRVMIKIRAGSEDPVKSGT